MTKRRTHLWILLWAAGLAGFGTYAAGAVNAQVRKCYAEVCKTMSDGTTICMEKEVECPKEQ